MTSLDRADRAIIAELRKDGRLSFAMLGRRIGLSEAATRQRYNRLRDSGVLQVVATTSAQDIGLIEAHIGVNVREKSVDEVASALARFREVKFVALGLGNFDIVCDLRCSTYDDYAQLLSDRIRRVPGVFSITPLMTLNRLKDSYRWEDSD